MLGVSMVGAAVACAAIGIVYRLPWLYVGILGVAAVCLVAFFYLRYFMVRVSAANECWGVGAGSNEQRP